MRGVLRIALIPTLAALATAALFARLGVWQLDRAAQKATLYNAFETRAEAGEIVLEGYLPQPRFQRVMLRGRFDPRVILLDNRTLNGVAGVHVLQPLQPIHGGPAVLVNRGWIAMPPDRRTLPPISARLETISVSGLLDLPPASGLRLGTMTLTDHWPQLVPYIALEPLSHALAIELAPQVLLSVLPSEPGLVQDWQPRVMTASRHHGYAVQWFALAMAVFVVWLSLSLRRRQ